MNERHIATTTATRPQTPPQPANHSAYTTQETTTEPSPLCVAHRGARAYAPENTLLAFAVAFDLGADAIECDVQISRDGRAVIIHDALVDRTTDGTGEVAEIAFAELSLLDAGRYPRIPQRIPTLEETLELVRARNGALNLEIKGETSDRCIETARVVAPILESLDDAFRARLLVSSFEHLSLVELKQRLPWLRIAALFGKEWRHKDIVAVASGLGAEAIHPAAQILDPDLVRHAHAADLGVNVWTVNAPHDLRRCIDWKVDGIVSDYPERVIIARSLSDTSLGAPFASSDDA